MKLKISFIIVIFLYCELSYAIKPSTKYSTTPHDMGLQYEEIRLQTNDGAILNVWHLPATGSAKPLIIAESDAGNMGDWLYLGAYLQSNGVDVWLFDYRGFGASSQFEIQQSFLFYMEFVEDLRAVVQKVYGSTGKSPYLLGLSMGSIVMTEYLKQRGAIPIAGAIFDGFVCDPYIWKERLSVMGKEIVIPEKFSRDTVTETPLLPRLYMVSKYDSLSTEEDIPSEYRIIQRFKCAHLEAFYKYPRKYIRRIIRFMIRNRS